MTEWCKDGVGEFVLNVDVCDAISMNVGGSCAPRAMVPIDQFRETRRQQQPSESNWLTDFFIYYLKTSRSSAVTCYSLSHASKRSLVSAGQARFPQASAEPKSSQRNCQLPTPILPPVISPTSPPAQSTATLNNSLGSNFIVRHIPDDPSNISSNRQTEWVPTQRFFPSRSVRKATL